MTKKEAQIVIGNIPIKPEVLDDCYSITEYQEAKTMAIKALEQHQSRCDSCIHFEEQDGSNCYECVKGMADNFEVQPCEDCISRKEAISAIQDKYYYHAVGIDIVDIVAHLPSVTPKAESEDRPAGRWIDIDCQSYTWQIKCPFCNHSRSMMSTQGIYPNYCENCGRKMEAET